MTLEDYHEIAKNLLLSISYYDKLEPELELELQQTNGWLKVTKLNDVAGKAGQDGKEASESINNVRNQRLKKNVSQLKLFVILSSFQQTTLAVFSLHLSILNLQSLNVKSGVIEAKILGSSRVFVS